jgi:hypothetical protein
MLSSGSLIMEALKKAYLPWDKELCVDSLYSAQRRFLRLDKGFEALVQWVLTVVEGLPAQQAFLTGYGHDSLGLLFIG